MTKKISSWACVSTLWAVFSISNSVHCNKVFQRARHFLLCFWKLLLHIHSSSFLWHTLDLQRNIWISCIQKSFTFYNPALFPWSMLGSKRQQLYLAFLSFSTSVLFCSYLFLRLDGLEFAKSMLCEMLYFDWIFALHFARFLLF